MTRIYGQVIYRPDGTAPSGGEDQQKTHGDRARAMPGQRANGDEIHPGFSKFA